MGTNTREASSEDLNNNKERNNIIMPETRVPMTLRDHFLEDPFFKSAWEDMENFRNCFFTTSSSSSASNMIENKEMKSSSSSNEVEKKDSVGSRFGKLLMPRKWLLPSSLTDMKNDSGVINIKNDDSRMEISLNTSGYKPSELSVNVRDGELIIEGRHEEKSESGKTMISRQFRRQYALSDDVKTQDVVSNLSQDGLLIVTLPKEKKIQEIKEDSRKIPVEHKQSRTEDARSESSMRKSSVEKEMKTSRRSSFESEKNEQSSTLERKTGQKINVERKSSTGSDKKSQQSSSIVPMNLRNTFFDDPFFQDNWLDIQQSQKNFFSQAEEEFKKRMDLMESSMNERFSLSKFFDIDKSDWMNAKLPEFSKLNLVDEHELKIVDVEDKLEISLDTTGYKPDELKVTAGEGVVMIEARHEERSEQGQVMVSRHMKRSYPLPASAEPHQVVSNLSRDGVLVITVPKIKTIKQQSMDVPININ